MILLHVGQSMASIDEPVSRSLIGISSLSFLNAATLLQGLKLISVDKAKESTHMTKHNK